MQKYSEMGYTYGKAVYPSGVEAGLSLREEASVAEAEGLAEVAHWARLLLLESVESASQGGVARVPREAERRHRRLRELYYREARQRRADPELVAERHHEASDRWPLGWRERAVDEKSDLQRRVERVEHAACSLQYNCRHFSHSTLLRAL